MEDNPIIGILIIVATIGYFAFSDSNDNTSNLIETPSYSFSGTSENLSLEDLSADDLRELLDTDIGDDARDVLYSNYFSGTKIFEACNQSNGNCYEVEADISDGIVDTVYFSNGGYISADGELDEYGMGDIESNDGNQLWEFNCLDCE